jgi:hypothetical protein
MMGNSDLYEIELPSIQLLSVFTSVFDENLLNKSHVSSVESQGEIPQKFSLISYQKSLQLEIDSGVSLNPVDVLAHVGVDTGIWCNCARFNRPGNDSNQNVVYHQRAT